MACARADRTRRRVRFLPLLLAILSLPAPASAAPFGSSGALAAGAGGASEGGLVDPGAGDGKPALFARGLLPQRLPSGAGWLLILLALPPLFWGWKIIRVTMAVFFALAVALLAYEGIAPRAGVGWGAAAAGGGMLVGAVVGWHIRKVFAALEVAVVLGFLFALPGIYFEHELATFGLGLAGAVLGLALGWMAAFYLDAIDSSLAGGFLAGFGAATVAQGHGPDAAMLIGIGVLAVSSLLGIAVQFQSVNRSRARES
mgnify:CR=1 FL=1